MLFKYISKKCINKKFIIKTIAMLLIMYTALTMYVKANAEYYEWATIDKSETKQTSSGLVSSSETVTDNPLGLTCGSACLIEQSSGTVIYDLNMHEKLRPASVTKVMSLLLIMEALDSGRISLQDKIPCTEDASKMGGSQIWLDVRETLTVDEMLKAIAIVSANDCVVAMADYLEGSQEAFVTKMNQKAKELGMNDTTFKNCHGIDEDGHVTSSYDIAIMSRELLTKHPLITKYTTIWMDSLRDGKSSLVNTNKLVRNYTGCTGLKTGSTSLALYNLSASATRDNLSLIGVVMRAPTAKERFADAQKLLDYGFSNYSATNLGKQGEVVQQINVNKGSKHTMTAILEEDVNIISSKKNAGEITKEIQLENTINAPILKGQKLGEIQYSMNSKVVRKVNIVAEEEIEKQKFSNITANILKSWFNLLRK